MIARIKIKPQNAILAIILMQSCLSAQPVHKARSTHIAHGIFGEYGTRSKKSHTDIIEELVHALLNASDYQKMLIADHAAERIGLERTTTQHALTKDPLNSPAYKHSLFILNGQISHLQKYSQSLRQSVSLSIKIQEIFIYWYEMVRAKITFFAEKTEESFVEKVAQDLDFYAYFEREHILTDYTKTLYLLSGYKTHPLPSILKFWDNPEQQNALLCRVKKYAQPVRIQAEVLIEEIAATAIDEVAMSVADIAITEEVDAVTEEIVATISNPKTILEDTAKALQEDLGDVTQIEDELLEGLDDEALSTEETSAEKSEPKKDSKTRREDRKAARSEKRAEIAAKEEVVLNNPETSIAKKGLIKVRQFIRSVMQQSGSTAASDALEDYVSGPISDSYKTHVYDTILKPFEKNILKETLDAFPHWIRPALDIGLQMNIMQGGGMIAYWESQEDAKLFKKLADKNAKLTNLNTVVQSTLKAEKAKKLNLAYKTFSETMQQLTVTTYANISDRLNAERIYRDHAFANIKPKQYFTVQTNDASTSSENSMTIDQRFALSLMLTPNDRTTSAWHNIFRQGNWLFTPENKSFTQTELVSLVGSEAKIQATNALYNSIFKEYYPSQTGPYSITVECTVTEYTEPCLIGVIFNNARWISGVPDRYHQHRFAGLYGTNGALYKVLEESLTTPEGQQKADTPNTQWPAYRIFSNPSTYTSLESKITALKQPFIFRLEITTAATEASSTFTFDKTIPPQKITKGNLSPAVFALHGIGFIATGCSAQFKIIEPKELMYTEAQLEAFKKVISS